MKIGIGYDIHALRKGRPLIVGGVRIPALKGSVGHSDGDVVLHAIVDAVLGAAGEPDIGTFFPDKDLRWKGADSLLFVKEILKILKRKKIKITHVDSTLVLETPKLGKFKEKIRLNIAKSLRISVGCVGFKAKTNEGFGAIGRGAAIACFAVASLEKGRGK